MCDGETLANWSSIENAQVEEEKGQIIGHLSFDICYLPFLKTPAFEKMTNDKCQMNNDQ